MTPCGIPRRRFAAAAPTPQSATIPSAGTSVTVVFSAAVTRSAGTLALNVGGVDRALTYSSGSGTTSLVYTVAEVGQFQVCKLAYTGPGLSGTVGGAAVADFSNFDVTNNSQAPGGGG